MDYTILVTNKQLQVVGDPITCWTMIDITLRFNEASSGLFEVPGYSWVREQFIPGCRVIVIRNNKVLIAGPVEKWLWERSDDGDNAGAGTLTVNFSDFLSLVAARLTYPDGTLTPSAQVTESWSFTGNAELALRELFDRNAGVGALADRQIPWMDLGPLSSVGSSVTATSERMEPLADVMRRVAVAGGNLGYRIDVTGDETQFNGRFIVYQPTDLSNLVVFGFGAASMKYIAYEVTAPKTNAAIVGGQGEGADRYMIERDNPGSQQAWDRRETLVARPGNDTLSELQADGDSTLADGAETTRMPVSAADAPGQQFGIDYTMGAKVSVETWPGSMISDLVVTVHIQVYPTAGEVISPTVGSQAENSAPLWIQQMRAMDRRMSYLERNVVPAAI